MSISQPRLLQDLSEEAPSKTVVAKSLVESAQRLDRSAPSVANLTSAIEDILPESHIKGASVMKIVLMDQGFELLDSGFFSPADDPVSGKRRVKGRPGTLDPLEINYPVHSKYWWRLSTLSPSSDGTITMTMVDRVQDELVGLRDKLQANRSAMTRAEFVKSAVDRVHEARFHSEQLHLRQPIDPVDLNATISGTSSKSASGNKTVGVGANHKSLTVKGRQMTAAQAAKANLILQVAHQHHAGEPATAAAIYAAIWESGMGEAEARNSLGYGGLLAGREGSDTDQANWFFTGGHGYQGGGALALERNHVTNPVEIAIRVEVPSIWPSNAYAREGGYPGDSAAAHEAQKIVQGGGGAAGAGVGGTVTGPGVSVEVIQPYFFHIGLGSNTGETDWDGITRLAQEVNWELFTDGPDVYYDSEMTLIKQKPSAVIHRNDAAVFDWNYDWENRNIATQFTLFLICDPFQFRAGEVIILRGFGVDEASTANLPGRWLIADIVRQQGSFVSQLSLKQPEAPKNEPAPQTTTVTLPGSTTGGGVGLGSLTAAGGTGNVGAAVSAAQRLSQMQLPYVWGGGHGSGQLDQAHPAGFDCSGSVCWVLHHSGMWGPSYAAVSGALATSWGQPGQGREMTIWANPGHCFIEFKLPNGHFQLNTSGLGPGPRFGNWGGPGAADAASGRFTPRHWPGT